MRIILLAALVAAGCASTPKQPAAAPEAAPEASGEVTPPSDVGDDAPPADDDEIGDCDSVCYDDCMATGGTEDDCMLDCC